MSPRGSLTRRRFLRGLGTLAAGVLLPADPAAAADFPQRTVRLVVPYSVGFGPDVVARTLAERLALAWKKPVIVENRPGASGIVAFQDARTAAADGHTLFIGDSAALAVNAVLHANLPYDPLRDLAPITTLFQATFAIIVKTGGRFGSVGAIIDEARRRPGQVTYATLGNGHTMHIAIESMALAAGVEMMHVPFRDGGTLIAAVANGDVDFTTLGLNVVAGMIKSHRLRPLAVAAPARLAGEPELPTITESGGPPVEMRPWAALMAVAGTPPAIVDHVRADVIEAMESAVTQATISNAGFEVVTSTPEEVTARMAQETRIATELLRAGRLRRV